MSDPILIAQEIATRLDRLAAGIRDGSVRVVGISAHGFALSTRDGADVWIDLTTGSPEDVERWRVRGVQDERKRLRQELLGLLG